MTVTAMTAAASRLMMTIGMVDIPRADATTMIAAIVDAAQVRTNVIATTAAVSYRMTMTAMAAIRRAVVAVTTMMTIAIIAAAHRAAATVM